jgi:hypothetical protein
MTRNEGTVDRAIRLIVGLVLAYASFQTGVGSGLGIVLIILAVVMLVTAAVGFCPLYKVLGNISTLRPGNR